MVVVPHRSASAAAYTSGTGHLPRSKSSSGLQATMVWGAMESGTGSRGRSEKGAQMEMVDEGVRDEVQGEDVACLLYCRECRSGVAQLVNDIFTDQLI